MSGRLRARDRRAIIVGLAVLVPVVVLQVGIIPFVQSLVAEHQELAQERSLLARESALLAQLDDVQRLVSDAEQALTDVEPRLLPGTNETLAAGALTRRLAQLAQDAQILLQQSELTEGQTVGEPFGSVGLSVQLVGDLEGLVRFLHAIESGAELLPVSQLSLRASGAPSDDLDLAQLMTMNAEVRGFFVAKTDEVISADSGTADSGTAGAQE